MNVFIVRPFGKKQINKKDKITGKAEEISFDFDAVENLLILPALKRTNLTGGTTGDIFEAGDIREDMFSLLLLADIVIADITVHNANVFYELGIRHALRDKKTILIKCAGFDETPFDILGYKYVSYEKDDPSAALPVMIQTLEDTTRADRKDSPVFNMLPKLQTQDPESFLAVPNDFGEEVEIAKAGRQTGKLALLADEVKGFAWEIPALRKIGEVQFQLQDFEDALISWGKVRNNNPDDSEANDRLATVYQRLAETEMASNPAAGWELLAQSDLAIKRLLDNYTKLDRSKRSEAYALKARNAKERWIDTWKNLPPGQLKTKALQSAFLTEAYENYDRGYNEDLNNFYPGVNALGMLTVITSLVESLPDVWEAEYDSKEAADDVLKKYKTRYQKLSTTVQASVDAEKNRLEREGKADPWLYMTEADLACLTLPRPARVGSLYLKVIQEANDLNFEAAKRQLLLYEQLGIMTENVTAALAAFTGAKKFEETNKRHYLLFTGHMIDKPDRKEPRFPPNKEMGVRAAIKETLQKEKEKIEGPIIGIAGGACGGDILFHEVCEELEIQTELYLVLPREQFLVESVQFAGPQWVERFDRLYKKLPRKILSQTKELPKWLQKKEGYSIWERNNLWMMNSALISGGINMTLVAVWDGKGGDSSGGTEHMVQVAKERGSKTVLIDPAKVNGS